MKKKSLLILFVVFFVAGCSFTQNIQSPLSLAACQAIANNTPATTTSATKKTAGTTSNKVIKVSGILNTAHLVSVCDLVKKPSTYVNKKVNLKATLRAKKSSSVSDYFLEGSKCRISVSSWAPLSVATCPPIVKTCKAPHSMDYYINKQLNVVGILKKMPRREYINKKWVDKGFYYIFTTNSKEVDMINN